MAGLSPSYCSVEQDTPRGERDCNIPPQIPTKARWKTTDWEGKAQRLKTIFAVLQAYRKIIVDSIETACNTSGHQPTENTMSTKIPHYRRNFKAGHGEETAHSILTTVLLAGLQSIARDGDYETYQDLYKETDFLLELHGLPTKDQ